MLLEIRSYKHDQLSVDEQLKVEDVMNNFEDAMVFVAIEKKPKDAANFPMVREVHAQIAIDAIHQLTGKIISAQYEGFRVEQVSSGSGQNPADTPGVMILDCVQNIV